MKRWSLLALIGVASTSAACAAILGIEDGILDTSLDGEGGIQICLSDSGIAPDQNQVFVSADIGDDGNSCGSLESPCKTLGAAIASLPKTRGANIIYVADGTYPETVRLPAIPPNLEIQGGWHVRSNGPSGVQWRQVCPDALTSADQIANIVGTENITIHADSVVAKLSHVAIQTKKAGAGESLYGIFATGPTNLTLNGVLILVGAGGDGTPGIEGVAGSAGGVGDCPQGDAGTPSPAPAGSGAVMSDFGANGVSPKIGGNGAPGAQGENGLAGADGGCATCYDCQVELGPCNTVASSCGAKGHSGCGGAGGGGGQPGTSGGSAIGIYAWGGAIIDMGGEVTVGNGGAGGPGGTGGNGGEGGIGTPGAPGTSCSTACSSLIVCTNTVASTGAGDGGAGSRGGVGATGGMGGGGAGGYSYAVFAGLDASVIVDGGAVLNHGNGGAGGASGGATGNYGARFP